MTEPNRVGDLDIEADLRFQRREWTLQRIGWAAMLALLVAGSLGLFGMGPLSDASAEAGPIQLDYARFARKQAPSKLRVRVAPDAVQQGEIRLWLDAAYLDRIELRGISPDPDQELAGSDRTVLVFLVADPAQAAEIRFDVKPAEAGRLRGQLGLVGGPEVAFTQVVYP